MAKTKAISIFNMDNYSSGSIWANGPARVESSRIGYFDFKKPGNDVLCLILVLQALDESGENSGDPKTQYYPIGKGINPINPIKGEKGLFSGIEFAADSEYDKLFGAGDFGVFMEFLKKTTFDMDAADDDITVLDGLTGEFVSHAKPQYAKAGTKDEGKPEEKAKVFTVVVISEVFEEGHFDGGKKGKGGKEKAAPAKGAAAKGKAKEKEAELDFSDSGAVVEAYLDSELTDDLDGKPELGFKIGISSWVKSKGGDADAAREAQSVLKDNFAALLTTKGWSVAKGKLSKD